MLQSETKILRDKRETACLGGLSLVLPAHLRGTVEMYEQLFLENRLTTYGSEAGLDRSKILFSIDLARMFEHGNNCIVL